MNDLTVLRSRAPRSPCVSMYFFRSWSQNWMQGQSRAGRDRAGRSGRAERRPEVWIRVVEPQR